MNDSFLNNAKLWLLDPAVRNALGYSVYSKLFGTIFASSFTDLEQENQLTNLPGEISNEEKFFLYNFFANIWSGQKNVLEIGPFLGSSTKPIALGMAANKNLNSNCKLHTFDRFGKYYPRELLLKTLNPLFDSGELSIQLKEKLEYSEEIPDFLDVFTDIHKAQSYWDLLSVNKKSLPEEKKNLATENNLLLLDPNIKFDAVFNDGCKSWYSVKYFTQELSKCIEPGGYVFSQDYGWKSCFWLPIFFHLLEDFFELVAYIRTTHLFRLTRPLDPGVIEARFPDNPESFGKIRFNQIFPTLIRKAAERGDLQGTVYTTLQHAAALAYIGEKDEARQIIANLAKQPISQSYIDNIQSHAKIPTYYPDGTQVLL